MNVTSLFVALGQLQSHREKLNKNEKSPPQQRLTTGHRGSAVALGPAGEETVWMFPLIHNCGANGKEL